MFVNIIVVCDDPSKVYQCCMRCSYYVMLWWKHFPSEIRDLYVLLFLCSRNYHNVLLMLKVGFPGSEHWCVSVVLVIRLSTAKCNLTMYLFVISFIMNLAEITNSCFFFFVHYLSNLKMMAHVIKCLLSFCIVYSWRWRKRYLFREWGFDWWSLSGLYVKHPKAVTSHVYGWEMLSPQIFSL